MTEIAFWYDFASTYSYLTAMRIAPLAEQAGRTVRWRPFLLGPIFSGQGWNTSPFNLYPAKGRYMWRDMERLCAQAGLPLRQPSQFPRHSVLAARVALVADQDGWCGDFTRRVYTANFAEDQDIAQPDVLAAIIQSLGHSADEVLSRAASQDTKQQLRTQTEEAARLGIFGAPTLVVDEELFWGNDRLEQALEWPLA